MRKPGLYRICIQNMVMPHHANSTEWDILFVVLQELRLRLPLKVERLPLSAQYLTGCDNPCVTRSPECQVHLSDTRSGIARAWGPAGWKGGVMGPRGKMRHYTHRRLSQSHLLASSAKAPVEMHSHHLFHVERLEVSKVCPEGFRILALV